MVATANPQIRRPPGSSTLIDVLDLILDKGIVIDAFVRVSLVGIELLTIDLRVVVASVDTYIHYAEAMKRLGMQQDDSVSLPDMVSGEMKDRRIRKTVGTIKEAVTGDGEAGAEAEAEPVGAGSMMKKVGSTMAEAVSTKLSELATSGMNKGVDHLVRAIVGDGSEPSKDAEEPSHARNGHDMRRSDRAEHHRTNGKTSASHARKSTHAKGRKTAAKAK